MSSGEKLHPAKVAALIGTQECNAWRLCKVLGIDSLPVEERNKKQGIPWPESRKQALIDAWYEGMPWRNLESEFGRGLRSWVKNMALPQRRNNLLEDWAKQGGAGAPWKYQDATLIALWQDAYELRLCHTDICRELRRSWDAVRQRAAKLRLPDLPRHCHKCGDLILDRPPNALLCQNCSSDPALVHAKTLDDWIVGDPSNGVLEY